MEEDCWNDSNTGNPGGGRAKATGTCAHLVVRGGSWVNSPQNLRSASRFGYTAGDGINYLGFRVARTFSKSLIALD